MGLLLDEELKNSTSNVTNEFLIDNIRNKYPTILFQDIDYWNANTIIVINKHLDRLSLFNQNLVDSIPNLILMSFEKENPRGFFDYENEFLVLNTMGLGGDLTYIVLTHESTHGYHYKLKKTNPDKFINFEDEWSQLTPSSKYLGDNYAEISREDMKRYGFARDSSAKNICDDVATLVDYVAYLELYSIDHKKYLDGDIFENKMDLLKKYGFLKL